jgi:hypothetical protein
MKQIDSLMKRMIQIKTDYGHINPPGLIHGMNRKRLPFFPAKYLRAELRNP